MFRKTQPSPETTDVEPLEADALQIMADSALEPVALADILDSVVPTGEKIEAKNLIGQEFQIMRAHSFVSAFEGQSHAWYVVGALVDGGAIFNTVLGGGAVTDVLDAWARAGRANPLRCTLTWNDGGRYRGYYTLE